jgi:NAD(P)-dependent dehydrogenase (short-subunit alcohol dehydrogenase family)
LGDPSGSLIGRGRVEGRVALVTGAGSGIGRDVCVRLAEEGAEVVVTSRNPTHVDATVQAVADACGRHVAGMVLDVSTRADIDSTIDAVARQHGRIDILSNNVGREVVRSPAISQTTDEEWERTLLVNLTGLFWVCRAAVPWLSRGASIVNVASVNSVVAWPNAGAYTSAKGALLQFTRTLALELADREIRANCVCPGAIDTPLTQEFFDAAATPEEAARLRAYYEGGSAFNRLGRAREVSNCVLFLASQEASFVTGAALMVDGGMTAKGS